MTGPGSITFTPDLRTLDQIIADNIRSQTRELRDQLAMSALTGLLANPDNFSDAEDNAKKAYKHADAMMKERDR